MLYQVVHRKPMHFKKVIAAIVLLIVSLLAGVVVGQWNGKEAVLQNGALLDQLNTCKSKKNLARKLAAAELAATVQEQAAQELQQKLTMLLSEKVELEDAVSFYRDLMEAGDKVEGLRVADFALVATSTPQVFQFSVLVTQIAENRKYVAGEVELKIVGVMQGQRQELIFDQQIQFLDFRLS